MIPSNETWRKSSRSHQKTNCVEVALSSRAVGIRDTKDRAGGTLTVTPQPGPGSWSASRPVTTTGADSERTPLTPWPGRGVNFPRNSRSSGAVHATPRHNRTRPLAGRW
ncbi:DUF397 domain-containing protein [Actinopolyspora sp. H202]|uniref:DUF397 domain-containing protein n=1 Tax=Actinopolyspora sp. H202 TaxID=1500456 RepID=UPI003EE62C8B